MPATDPEMKKLVQQVSRETAKAVSANVSKKAVRETLVSMGLNPDDPLTMQETQANLRKVARCADDLKEIVDHYKDPETVEAIKFAKKARGIYHSTKARAFAGALFGFWLFISAWASGIWENVTKGQGG